MVKSKAPKKPPNEDLDKKMQVKITELSQICKQIRCYPFLLESASIGKDLVDNVFEALYREKNADNRLLVLIDSSGGDIDAAYNLVQIFRKFGSDQLQFVVPRWAKSAATLVVCGGDKILMAPPAELGPLDPQIHQMNPLEKRLEHFSPLHIESTLELIRNEYKEGNKELADQLMSRLQFPLTLGSFTKSLDISKQYLERVLASRMLKDNGKLAKDIAEKLTTGYADHGYCINLEEAQDIGLKAEPIPDDCFEVVWEIYKTYKERRERRLAAKRKEIAKRIKELPQEILDALPPTIRPEPTTPSSARLRT